MSVASFCYVIDAQHLWKEASASGKFFSRSRLKSSVAELRGVPNRLSLLGLSRLAVAPELYCYLRGKGRVVVRDSVKLGNTPSPNGKQIRYFL